MSIAFKRKGLKEKKKPAQDLVKKMRFTGQVFR